MVKPPETAESQALMFSAPECGDVGSSLRTSMMDVSDVLPIGFPSFDNFTPLPPPTAMEDSVSKNQEASKNASASAPMNNSPPSSGGEFDHQIKSEVLMTFAPEYRTVETPRGVNQFNCSHCKQDTTEMKSK
ncbi:Hypothetical predicted protein [Olea europaea subsp. europaea]|uniref:Mediator of RNA polymerase II transcription subunit 13 n=1 Tax=Olea europaea subsp. europaea TaxID=158383 RepID=A0A8S0UVG5_OLEEU|nr:Hypothetical predicted protein [Olea europaea subsp. europaea]